MDIAKHILPRVKLSYAPNSKKSTKSLSYLNLITIYISVCICENFNRDSLRQKSISYDAISDFMRNIYVNIFSRNVNA